MSKLIRLECLVCDKDPLHCVCISDHVAYRMIYEEEEDEDV